MHAITVTIIYKIVINKVSKRKKKRHDDDDCDEDDTAINLVFVNYYMMEKTAIITTTTKVYIMTKKETRHFSEYFDILMATVYITFDINYRYFKINV